MNPVATLFDIVVFGLSMFIAVNVIKRKRFNAMPKPTHPKNKFKSNKLDAFQAYSNKNKECFEHEVQTRAERPAKRRSLWNEPSWDDELYEKK